MADNDSDPVSAPLPSTGAVVVITGGASGIGRAMGERWVAEGAQVALVDLDAATVEKTASEIGGVARGYSADVSDGGAVATMVTAVEADLGPIEVYCSNAGLGDGGDLGTDAEWARSWGVHLMAHVHATREVIPLMERRGGGHVVITASAAGLLMMMQSAPYTVTKHAAVSFAEWLAVNHGDRGIGVHCLCPQGVRTPMVAADPVAEAEVAASGTILEPSFVADKVVEAVRSGTFLILPHPEVHDYETSKVDDRDRWLALMRKLRARFPRSR
ncbi:MAG: SDR family oxidoreductase [Actinomycetota bacterium]|nr:SDR family oxidoreductase [Actinomycetota bacterium]